MFTLELRRKLFACQARCKLFGNSDLKSDDYLTICKTVLTQTPEQITVCSVTSKLR